MPTFFLTEEDITLIKETVRFAKQAKLNPQLRGNQDPPLPQAPGIYVVRSPAAGVPALSLGSDTGTSSTGLADDVPGTADCQVYQKIGTLLKPVTGFTINVNNLTNLRIPPNTLFTAVKDKYGKWYAASIGRDFAEC